MALGGRRTAGVPAPIATPISPGCMGESMGKRRRNKFKAQYFQSLALHPWRREWDSNPRYGCPYTRFPSVRLQPLGHPSGAAPVMATPEAFGKGWAVSRAQRDAKRCAADPGSFEPAAFWRSRICGAPLRAAPRPGHVPTPSRACATPPPAAARRSPASSRSENPCPSRRRRSSRSSPASRCAPHRSGRVAVAHHDGLEVEHHGVARGGLAADVGHRPGDQHGVVPWRAACRQV